MSETKPAGKNLGNASDALGGKRRRIENVGRSLPNEAFSSEDAKRTHCIIRQDYGGNEDEEGLAGWGRGVYPFGSVSFNPSSINSISCCQPSKHMYLFIVPPGAGRECRDEGEVLRMIGTAAVEQFQHRGEWEGQQVQRQKGLRTISQITLTGSAVPPGNPGTLARRS